MSAKSKQHPKPQDPVAPGAAFERFLPYGLAIFLGGGVVGFVSLLFPSFMRCTPLNDAPSWLTQAAAFLISQIVPPILSLIIPKIPRIKTPSQKTLVTYTLSAGLVFFAFVRFGLPTPAETVCYPDLKTLYGLIDAEGEAVLKQDMNPIGEIYAPDAVIEDLSSGQKWGNPTLYYGQKFNDQVHCSLSHSNYTRIRLTSTEATLTTASSGTWGLKTNKNGCTETYNNPPGSDSWSFKKMDGQWRISGFRFNCYAAPEKCLP